MQSWAAVLKLWANLRLLLFQITVYAAYLYDAIMLYARALDAVLKENGSATDGVAIFNKLNGTFYQSKSNQLQKFLPKSRKETVRLSARPVVHSPHTTK